MRPSCLFVALAMFAFLPPPNLFSQENPQPGQPGAESPTTRPGTEKKDDSTFPLLSSVGRRNEAALKLFQTGARREYLTALELKDKGRLREALGRFQDFRILYPAHPGETIVLRQIVDIYEKLSLPGKALAELKAYLDMQPPGPASPDSLPLYAGRADLEYRLGLWAEASSSYRKVLRLFPKDPIVGKIRIRLREIQGAGPEKPGKEPATEVSPPGNSERSRPDRETDVSTEHSAKDESSLDRLGEGLDSEN